MKEESIEIKPPFFSVVIPVYNKEPHIARSINSVLNQTFQDVELIIVCDPSTDNSNAEVAKFTDPRIRVFHRDEPGPGGYAARNLGIKEAKAEWVAFLDADDEWYPEHLEQFKKLSVEFPQAAVLGCGCEVFDPEKATAYEQDAYYKKNYGRGNHYLSFEDYLTAEVSGTRPLNGITACIKKYILLNADGFPAGKASRGGDVDTWLRCIEKSGGVAWSSHIGAIYYRDSVNMVTRSAWSDASDQRETVNKLLGRYNGNIAKLLKKHSNKRTISAWRLNNHMKDKKNFIVLDKLYINVEKRKSLFWIIVSLMPSFVFDLIIKIKPAIKKNVIPWLKKHLWQNSQD